MGYKSFGSWLISVTLATVCPTPNTNESDDHHENHEQGKVNRGGKRSHTGLMALWQGIYFSNLLFRLGVIRVSRGEGRWKGRGELSCYSSSEFQAAAPLVSNHIYCSPGSYQWRIGSDLQALGELVWWSSSDGAGAPDVGVERECFFSSLNICGASSLPLPVLLNLSTCTTEPKLLTQRTLSNSIPHSRWLCVCDCVYVLQRKCALYTSRSSISSHFLVDERKMLRYCCWWNFWFCVVHYELWVSFKGPLTCILRVFTD